MAHKRQREVALAILAVVLVGTIVWRVQSVDPPTSVARTNVNASAPRASQQQGNKRDLAEVNLEALEAERPEPSDSNRNPFRFKPKPPPPPPTPALGKRPPGQATTGPVEPSPPPPIPLKFIGVVHQDDPRVGRVAVLSDSRGVYYGRKGEIIEGRYRILEIGVESIDLAYLDGRGRQTIRQTGQ